MSTSKRAAHPHCDWCKAALPEGPNFFGVCRPCAFAPENADKAWELSSGAWSLLLELEAEAWDQVRLLEQMVARWGRAATWCEHGPQGAHILGPRGMRFCADLRKWTLGEAKPFTKPGDYIRGTHAAQQSWVEATEALFPEGGTNEAP